jgi:hypothetical protein
MFGRGMFGRGMFGRGIDNGKPGVYICREREGETLFRSVRLPNKLTAPGEAID